MKFGKALKWFSIFSVAIFMVVLITLVPAYDLMQSETNIAEDTSMAAQFFQELLVRKLLGKEFTGPAMEESDREVPTGPDPLHHHDIPTKP